MKRHNLGMIFGGGVHKTGLATPKLIATASALPLDDFLKRLACVVSCDQPMVILNRRFRPAPPIIPSIFTLIPLLTRQGLAERFLNDAAETVLTAI